MLSRYAEKVSPELLKCARILAPVGHAGTLTRFVQAHPGVARMIARISLSTSNLDGARVAPDRCPRRLKTDPVSKRGQFSAAVDNRGIPSRTRPCTSSCLERFPLRGHRPDPSPPRAGAAYRWEVAFLLHPQEPHAVVPARMA